MLKYVLSTFIFITPAFSSCIDKPAPSPIDQESVNLCQNAFNHLNDMCVSDKKKNQYCCKVIEPTKRDKDFVEFCQETMGNKINLNTKCLSEVKSCDEIDNCTNSK